MRARTGLLFVTVGVTVALGSVGSTAWADGETTPLGSAQLHYARSRGAESCPDEVALSAEVILRLGYDPFNRAAPRVLEVVIGNEGGQLRATITMSEEGRGPSTHRLVSSALDCSVLRPALGLAIALAIDPARALAVDVGPAIPPPAPPKPFPKPLPEPQDSLRAPVDAHTSIDRTRRLDDERPGGRATSASEGAPTPRHGTFYGGAYAAVAAAPTTTGGFELGGAVVYRHFSIGVELRGDLPVQETHGTGRIEVGRVFVEGVPCFRTIAFGFGFCALAAVGLTIARGHGYRVSRDTFLPYVGVGARLMVEIPIAKRVAFGLHADVLGLLTRANLKVDADTQYGDAPAAGAFGFNFVGRFGDGT